MLKLVVNNEEKSPVARLLEIGALLDLVPIGESHLSTSAVVKMESEAYRLVRLGLNDPAVVRACHQSAFLDDLLRFVSTINKISPATRPMAVGQSFFAKNLTSRQTPSEPSQELGQQL